MKPILFSTQMVKAILAGKKSKTRRIVKIPDLIERPDRFRYVGNSNEIDIWRKAIPYDNRVYYEWQLTNSNGRSWVDHAKYEIGDILWVRETFYAGYVLDNNDSIPENAPLEYWYFADTMDARPGDMSDSKCSFLFGSDKKTWPKWKPSIFMPKEAARIFLRVTDVRCERLQEITKEDAIAEGIEVVGEYYTQPYPNGPKENIRPLYNDFTARKNPREIIGPTYFSATDSYHSLWNKINGKDSWNQNPWVWKITFERIEKPVI